MKEEEDFNSTYNHLERSAGLLNFLHQCDMKVIQNHLKVTYIQAERKNP